MSNIKYKGNAYEIKGRYLDLNSKDIRDITLIESLQSHTYLEALNLRNNRITEIKGLDVLQNLKRLYLNDNEIIEISGLEKLNNLEILHLGGNKITEIKGLDALQKLKRLHLNDNLIKKIKGLENLQNLEYLELMDNQIKEIEGLDALPKLFYLSLVGNKMKDPDEEYLIQKTSNAQDYVEKCKFKKIGQNIPFIKFKQSLSFEDNIDTFRNKHLNISDISFFVTIGTHKESKQFKGEQNAVFLLAQPEEILLSKKDKQNFKDIIIHLVQLHSLKGIEFKTRSKIDYFNFFIRNFWNEREIESNNILIYDSICESRVRKKIEEFLELSVNIKIRTTYSKPDIIVFPENSIPKNMINYLKEYSKNNHLIIIGGLEHIRYENKFINKVIIIDQGKISEQIKQTPVWIWDKRKREYIKENIKCEYLPKIKVFITSVGKVAIFICKDFLRLSEIIPYWVEKYQLEFIIIPSLTAKVLPFQARLLSVLNYPQCKNTKFIFNNIGEYGGSELFSVVDNWRIEENFRKKKFDNFGEKIIIRKIERTKPKYLELISREIDICHHNPDKLKKLQIYREDIEEDHLPYTLTNNLSLKWKDGNPFITESHKIPLPEILRANLDGFCIRCKKQIPFNQYKPYCYDDWQEWLQWNNPFYEEKFCHKCGEPSRRTIRKPLCNKCYQS